jgi:hypothetical protein
MHSSWKFRGGLWGFGQNLFRGVLGVVKKSRGPIFCLFSCFIAFLCDNFWDLTPAPPPPPCVHLYVELDRFSKVRFLKEPKKSIFRFEGTLFNRSTTSHKRWLSRYDKKPLNSYSVLFFILNKMWAIKNSVLFKCWNFKRFVVLTYLYL